MKKDNYSLNKEEKTEIVTDVKAAFEKARKSSNITYKNIEINVYLTIIYLNLSLHY